MSSDDQLLPKVEAISENKIESEETPVISEEISNVVFDPFDQDSFSINEPFCDFSLAFWEKTYELYRNVCDPFKRCEDCLVLIEDLAIFVRKERIDSPTIALALDIVVQRAMYELSDKMCRIRAKTDETSPNINNKEELPCTVRNIDNCIAVMLQVVTPLINKIANKFNCSTTPQFQTSRVATLTRQLQELISWTNFEGQVTVPESFPKYSNLNLNSSQDLNAYPAAYNNPTVCILDNTISGMLREVNERYSVNPHFVSGVQSRLYQVLNNPHTNNQLMGQNMQNREIGVHFCGALALGLSDAESAPNLDFISETPLFNCNFHNPELQRKEMQNSNFLVAEAKKLEFLLENEILHENAIKHFKSCMKDFRSVSVEFMNYCSSGQCNEANQQQSSSTVTYNGPHQPPISSPDNTYNNGSHSSRYVPQPPKFIGSNGSSSSLVNQQGTEGNTDMSPNTAHNTTQNNANNSANNSLNLQLNSNVYSPRTSQIKSDSEVLKTTSEQYLETLIQGKASNMRINPVISEQMRQLEGLTEQIEKRENDRFTAVRKVSKTIEKILKDCNYTYIRVVSHKTRFLHLKFNHLEYGLPEPVNVNLIIHNVLPLQSTDLLNAYMTIDKSNKIRDFLHIIKLFVKSHRICDPSAGFLSSFAWYTMALHMLLRYEFLPNIHDEIIYRSLTPRGTSSEVLSGRASGPNSSRSNHGVSSIPNAPHSNNSPLQNNNNHYMLSQQLNGGGGLGYDNMASAMQFQQEVLYGNTTDMRFNSPRLMYLPAKYVAKIENTSIFELLDLFFRYYVEKFDIFGGVVSLKEKGEVLRKSQWPKSPIVLWRLSIEDPFDNISSLQPHDLGASLSRPGQLTTFKALRRAIYGIHSIVALGIDTCQANIKKFFSRTDLIHLARKSEYLGAVITPSAQWSRDTCYNTPRPMSKDYRDSQSQVLSSRSEMAAALESERREYGRHNNSNLNSGNVDTTAMRQPHTFPANQQQSQQQQQQIVKTHSTSPILSDRTLTQPVNISAAASNAPQNKTMIPKLAFEKPFSVPKLAFSIPKLSFEGRNFPSGSGAVGGQSQQQNYNNQANNNNVGDMSYRSEPMTSGRSVLSNTDSVYSPRVPQANQPPTQTLQQHMLQQQQMSLQQQHGGVSGRGSGGGGGGHLNPALKRFYDQQDHSTPRSHLNPTPLSTREDPTQWPSSHNTPRMMMEQQHQQHSQQQQAWASTQNTPRRDFTPQENYTPRRLPPHITHNSNSGGSYIAQEMPNSARYRQEQPNSARYFGQDPPNSARYGLEPPNSARFEQEPPNSARYSVASFDDGSSVDFCMSPRTPRNEAPNYFPRAPFNNHSGSHSQQQQQQAQQGTKTLRPDAAVFNPGQSFQPHTQQQQHGGMPRQNIPMLNINTHSLSNQSMQQNAQNQQKQSPVPMLPLTGFNARVNFENTGPPLPQSDRFLDLSSLHTTHSTSGSSDHSNSLRTNNNMSARSPDSANMVFLSSRTAESCPGVVSPSHSYHNSSSGSGGNSSRVQPNFEFQEIMEKMTLDALEISQSIVSARSTRDGSAFLSARSSAPSGVTTVERYSSYSLSNTPRQDNVLTPRRDPNNTSNNSNNGNETQQYTPRRSAAEQQQAQQGSGGVGSVHNSGGENYKWKSSGNSEGVATTSVASSNDGGNDLEQLQQKQLTSSESLTVPLTDVSPLPLTPPGLNLPIPPQQSKTAAWE